MLLLFLWKNSVFASNFSFFLFFPVLRATAERKGREVMTSIVLPSFDWFTPDQTNKSNLKNAFTISEEKFSICFQLLLFFLLSCAESNSREKGKRGHDLHCLAFIWLVDLWARPQKRGPISRPRVGTQQSCCFSQNPFVRYASKNSASFLGASECQKTWWKQVSIEGIISPTPVWNRVN